MNKKALILKYFQKEEKLTVRNRQYQETISSLFKWLIDNDNVNNDITSKYFPNKYLKAKIIAKQAGIAAGIEETGFLLKKHTHLDFKPLCKNGTQFKNGEEIAVISGKSHEILGYERTILNILQRMSGIATETNHLIHLINQQSTTNNQQLYIAATRKTPWMSLDKKAVAVGGGLTHRLNLSDGILIKDNHLALISKAIKAPRESKELIEIEVENYHQAYQAIKTFNKFNNNHLAILLDNFSPSRAKNLLSKLSNRYDLSQIIFEASGGINRENIAQYAQTGVDIISLGALTHSTQTANLSLEFG